MAGIYIHIPFCKKACNYCNFHFSTSLKQQQQLVNALVSELIIRKDYVLNETIESIYIGGGTPSILSIQQLEQLLDTIYLNYNVIPKPEITLEANPDDLSLTKIQQLKKSPINRLSIGVQSFFDEELQWMNRAHTASEAITAIKGAQNMGLTNITIDLIYGSPTLTHKKWEANLQTAVELNLTHISSYCLTVEPKTALANLIQKNQLVSLNEEQASSQFYQLVDTLEKEGFEQYEISNFAKNGNYAIHNTNYWKNKIYLGIGPSAHSFNKHSRSWNIAHNIKYIKGIESNKIDIETEILTIENRMNEYIMTSLRTIWGLNMDFFEQEFTAKNAQLLEQKISQKIGIGLMTKKNNYYILNKQARIMADGIASDLFM
jgi:oxygen-independent coproporphyrinogen-3 oxidase